MMVGNWFKRILIGLLFALPAGLAVTVGGQAMQEPPPPEGDCQGCHEIIRESWKTSTHARAISDPVFQEAWDAQGSPQECLTCHTTGFDPQTGTWEADGVSCTVCHYPEAPNHPEQIMPTDVSSGKCGECHLDTYDEWTDSMHAKEDLDCVRCHNPHTTDLKAIDTLELCRACHNETVHLYTYTAHFQEGLLCTDCHLNVSESQMGEGHGKRVHTLTVDSATCGNCHGDDLHAPMEAFAARPQTPEQASVMSLMDNSLVQSEPESASPWGFALLAGLVGLALGMILAPWLEKWYRSFKL